MRCAPRCNRDRASRRNRTDDPLPTMQLLLPAELERHSRERSQCATSRGAGDGNRTRRDRCGAPVCHHDTSPAWWSRVETGLSRILVGADGTSEDPQVGWVGIESVPPSGIEPEPLGLQPSAQTNYARVGWSACLAGHSSSSSLFGCQRSAAMRRAHLGRRCICACWGMRGRTYLDSRSRLAIQISSRRIRLCERGRRS